MNFGDHLGRLMEEADFEYGDLHHWFDAPRATVRAWVECSREPRGAAGKLARERLILLEHAVEYQRGLPAPRSLSAQARPTYIRQVRDGLERNGVLKNGAAR